MTSYDEFIASKVRRVQPAGFEPSLPLHAKLFDWQALMVTWAVRQGRAAMFADCGLGKTLMQLEWARHVSFHSSGAVLILCPLAVGAQTVAEAQKFGFPPVTQAHQPEDIRGEGIYVTNYDRVHLFEDVQFSGVVLDESSILKSFDGKMRRYLTDRFAGTDFRLCCTATPAPNDFTELGQHAEFLGICSPAQMLATYFINDTADTRTWRLKGHAEEEFWRWVSSWAVCVSKPSDIGFSDEGFELPPLRIEPVWVDVDEVADAKTGELFRQADLSATSVNQEMRRTLKQRVEAVQSLVQSKEQWAIWCNLNDEQDAIEDALGLSCVSVRGGDRELHKIERERRWRAGEVQNMVSKGSIFGYGMNWQHCSHVIYFPTYSFEDFYQVIRRFWRFGQKNPVTCYVVLPRTAQKLLDTLKRKQEQHETMRELMGFTRENLITNSKPMIQLNTEIQTKATERWTLHNGDCVRVLREKVADESVGFSIFSPPFADLFTYSNDVQDMGNCAGLDEFMRQFEFLIDELQRVTMPGREVAVHCCDLLATKWKDGAIEFKDFSGAISAAFRARGFLFHSRITIWKSPVTEMQRTKAHGLLYKTLQKDSSNSRVGAPDYLLVFRKRGENPKPIAHTPDSFTLDDWQEIASPVWMTVNQTRVLNGELAREQSDERHICPLQLDVIERALKLWSAPDDLVLSPFAGIGSEGFCAVKMGRRFVGAELKPSYWQLACTHLLRAEEESHDLFTINA
jgi:DNA modification methylase